MRAILCLALFAALLMPATAWADNHTEVQKTKKGVCQSISDGPLEPLTWPFVIFGQVLGAPVDMAKGGVKTINTMFLPPDKPLAAPKLGMPKLPELDLFWFLKNDEEDTGAEKVD